ncbi:hypothetical protein NEOLEDRAFT_1143944 [Neolentinus lepideus HHB14362 ss-1]|uniref:Uncharacterized protein n=1 Tax=Neolentinus lepideus HHB14362 ss-1 TaxID=1314782 RepID=A0A165M7G9_9AGAM|nr:hypothetical protein NEOLEDRAFT_1143944 [Neolentinus lepideus HHB14362 ss-1]
MARIFGSRTARERREGVGVLSTDTCSGRAVPLRTLSACLEQLVPRVNLAPIGFLPKSKGGSPEPPSGCAE